ncbi:type VII secretion protein EccB [Nocardia otitidiscaviarum]|uniref:Type VII secretion protein EccB n=1 Tax=Nocardia otitidiscaviarum TaxID=1823 RepID=A0A516NS42_9NOCA|nr:type VII secretion protein EccB [Nocardia otitidiscaviarum]MCP9620960.1 type VII secretion protein EccB [Nocardia otitidiscaviarum]QDP81728.1 type VII secretion protein EccB [Nocardia otitidiscaviarum]
MPSKPTTRWQVSGYRFLVRRMEHALVRRDVRMLHDPMRSQSRAFAVGLVLALVALAGCGVLALLRPQDKMGNSTILIGKDSGAVYVVIDGVVHPALNLASARLAAGEAAAPATVKESELGKKPRGQLIGIPGAPASLNFDDSGRGRAWTVCDTLASDGSGELTTAVLAGDPELAEKAGPLAAGRALLVRGRESAYLVYDDRRARVDMNDRAVVDALGIRGMTPRPVSEGLLNAIPEVLPIVPPPIADVGAAPGYPLGDHRIGDVVQVRTDGSHYVVLADGLQPVSELTADIVRNTYRATPTDTHIAQADRTAAPVSSALRVADYPAAAPEIIDGKDQPVACLSWQPVPVADKSEGSTRAELTVLTGHTVPIPDRARLVSFAQADGSGPHADAFYMPPGAGAYAQSTGIEPDSERRDSLFYISDFGVRYGIVDLDAAKALGMDPDSVRPERAPWQLIGLLAPGPALSRAAAMVAHDGVAPDANPAKEPVRTQN